MGCFDCLVGRVKMSLKVTHSVCTVLVELLDGMKIARMEYPVRDLNKCETVAHFVRAATRVFKSPSSALRSLTKVRSL